MREIAEKAATAKGTNAIFEGYVEKQDIMEGSIGAPGNAMSITPSGAHRKVTIRVSRLYRGAKKDRVVVFTGMGDADCGFDFETNNGYLVFATEISEENLFTSICTATDSLEHSGPALRYLRGQAPLPEDFLDQHDYRKKVGIHWFGTVCGNVLEPDGKPLGGAVVELAQIRDPSLPSREFGDPNLSKADGSFCVQAYPGNYLLTAEQSDFNHNVRLVGFYPGVKEGQFAVPIQVKADSNISNIKFRVFTQLLYTVQVRVVRSNGSPLPWKQPWLFVKVVMRSPEVSSVSYKLARGLDEDGSCTFGYVPPGHYSITAYVHPPPPPEGISNDIARSDLYMWQRLEQEVTIAADSQIILKLAKK